MQYEASKGLSVLQSGLILDKFADNENFSAAILELAYLGHLEIDQKDKKVDPVLLCKEKDTIGLTMDQKYLLDHALFKRKRSFTLSAGSSSKASASQEGFGHINYNLYTWSVGDGYMVENPQHVRKSFLWKSILWLLPVAGLVFYTLYATLGEEAIFIFIFPLVFGSAGIGMMMSQKKWLAKLPGLLFIGAAMMPLLIMQQQGINFKEFIMGPIGVMFVVIGAFIFTYKKIGKSTQKGAYASKHLLGLKEFIKHVKQDEIKRHLDMDPLYLEKMLPYAVLFNETKHWLSFYDILNVKTPY